MAVAEVVHKKPPHYHVASNEPKGRSVKARREMEELLNGQNAEREAREKIFYENLYTKYKGDPQELPWNRV